MDTTTTELFARASSNSSQPPVYKAIGITLAICSGLFIGSSFVLKKIGLLKANVKYNEEAGEGYGYLRNFWWWTGMVLMIVGEICNFVAYAFVDAILVTPMGALSVVVTTILSAIFLKERLSFVGKVGCLNCIVGSVVIAMNAPQQSSVSTIQDMQHYVIAPGFLSYGGVIIIGCLFTAFWAGPRYGKDSMFVYLTICSLIGGLSVVATQGLGAAILAQARHIPQFNQWFLYVVLVFVITTLLTEIIYLNKALNIFNAAIVTPTYYVYFTSSTIVTSAILFQGFGGSGIAIATLVMGFIQICTGVILLQLSKSAKDVPDAAIFKGDLDQIREVSEQEQPETEPKADAIRGTAAIIRRISLSRQKMEQEEARRFFRELEEDRLKPPAENEIIEWDGLRRRKTVIGEGPTMTSRSLTLRSPHPPLGMSRFPDENQEIPQRPMSSKSCRSFLGGVRERASAVLHPTLWRAPGHEEGDPESTAHPVALTEINVRLKDDVDTTYHGPKHVMGDDGEELEPPFQHKPKRERSDTPRSIAWADETSSEHTPSRHSHRLTPELTTQSARRQFSFQRVFHRRKTGEHSPPKTPASPVHGILRRSDRVSSNEQRHAMQNATEEERLGLVKGDSRVLDDSDYLDEKLDRESSPSVDSALDTSEEPRKMYAHPQKASTTSTMSTAPFPPYEDTHPHHIEPDSSFPHPPFRQESLSETHGIDGWSRFHPGQSIPHHPASHHGRPPATGRANTLPAIPAEELMTIDGASDVYVRVEQPSPERASSSPEPGMTALSSSASGRNHGRRRESWRREPHPELHSNSSSESGDEGRGSLMQRGAFI